jgi:hypothetical protein
LKNLYFSFDKIQVEKFQVLLENKEGNKNKNGKKKRDRTKKQNKQLRRGIRNKSINTYSRIIYPPHMVFTIFDPIKENPPLKY